MSMIKRAERRLRSRDNSGDGEDSLPFRRVRSRGAVPLVGDAEPTHADGSFEEDFLLSAVGGMDRKAEEIRTGSEFIHVSSLIDYCARREALAFSSRDGGAMVKTRPVYSGDRLVWAIGRAVEKHIREQFIASGKGGGSFGSWSCVCGSTTMTGFRPSEFPVCERCGKEASNYGEHTLVDFQRKIVGNPDLIYLRPDNGLFRVVEIKSMNGPEFNGLEAPLHQHVIQALCYQRILSEQGEDTIGYGADDAVTIFYASKVYNMKPYKSFTVPVTPEWRNRIDDLWSHAETRAAWIRARKGGISQQFPSRLSRCPDAGSTMAKNCPECVGCFSNP